MSSLDGKKLNVSLSSLKEGFKDYLENLALKDDKKDYSSSSIFLHSEEFKNYLVEEVGMDSSVLSKSITSIVEEVTKEFSKPKEEDTKEISKEDETVEASEGEVKEADETEEAEEVEEAGEKADKTENKDEPFMVQALNEALADDEVKSILDGDENGELSLEEIKNFLMNINGLIDNPDELSFEELAKAVKSIYEGNYQELISPKEAETVSETKETEAIGETTKAEAPTKTVDSDNKTDNASQTAPQTSSPSGNSGGVSSGGSSGGVSSGGGASGASYGSRGTSSTPTSANLSSNETSNKPTESMSLSELQVEQTKRAKKVQDCQSEIAAINSGEKFKEDEKNVENLKEEYEKALSGDSSYQEALDKNGGEPKGLAEIEEETTQKEKEIADIKTQISQAQIDISAQKSVVSGLDTQIASLKETKNAISQNGSNDAQDQIAKIDKQIAQLEKQRDSVEKPKLQELEKKLEADNNGLKNSLAQKEEELSNLNEAKKESLKAYEDSLSDSTKGAKEKYESAKKELDSSKEEALKKAQAELLEAQKGLDEVNKAINDKKAQEAASEYSTGKYNAARGQKLVEAANRVQAGKYSSQRMCGKGVADSYHAAFPDEPYISGNGNQWDDLLEGRKGWANVTDEYTYANLSQAPAGAIVVLNEFPGNPYGHVYISDGKGGQLSDFIATVERGNNFNLSYFQKKGSQFKVYIPT